MRGSVYPGCSPPEEIPLRADVVQQAGPRPLQCEGTAQQDRQHQVGGQRCEPDYLTDNLQVYKASDIALCHLPTLVETFPDDQIDEDPGQAQAAHQLPLDPAQTFLQSRVGPQHSVTTGQVRSGQVRSV